MHNSINQRFSKTLRTSSILNDALGVNNKIEISEPAYSMFKSNLAPG